MTAFLLLETSSSGCRVIGGIFKAGFWVGVIVVAVILVGTLAVVRMIKKP